MCQETSGKSDNCHIRVVTSAGVPLQFTDHKLGSDLKFDVMDFKGPTREPEDNVMSSMLDSAKIFSEIWETGVHVPGHVYCLNQLLCHACIAAMWPVW